MGLLLPTSAVRAANIMRGVFELSPLTPQRLYPRGASQAITEYITRDQIDAVLVELIVLALPVLSQRGGQPEFCGPRELAEQFFCTDKPGHDGPHTLRRIAPEA